jgi:glycosyltransferase involved in cell wall biosynthesis
MKNLTLVIPVKNEVESLPKFLSEVIKLKYKVMLVIDSKDKNSYNSKLYQHRLIQKIIPKKTGYGNALIGGINKVKTKYFCIINADGSMNPKDIKKMMKLTNKYSFIFCSRYLLNAGSEDDTIVTYFGNRFFSLFGNLLFGLKISDILYTYLIGETKLAKKIKLNSHDFRICVELPIKVHKAKINYTDVESHERPRIGGVKKVNALKDGLLILVEMFKMLIQNRSINLK